MNTSYIQMNQIESYLQQILPDNSQRDHLIDRLAQIVKGTPHDRKMMILDGDGSNGKTVFLHLLGMVLGNQCVTISPSILEHPNPLHLACLVNKKLVILDEMPFNLSTIKSWLDKDQFSYQPSADQPATTAIPQFDIVTCVNSDQEIPINLIRRIEYIRFPNRFVDQPDPNKSFELQKYNLSETLFHLAPLFHQLLIDH